MGKLPTLLLLASLSTLALASACRTARPAATRPARVNLGLAEAIGWVRVLHPSATIIRAELRYDRYAVDIMSGNVLLTIHVDANDASIREFSRVDEVGPEARIAAVLAARARFSFIQAIAKAERDTNGTAFKAEIERDDYRISLDTDRGPVVLILDRKHGDILARTED
jgi:uncharacterized membrane protein YkoI